MATKTKTKTKPSTIDFTKPFTGDYDFKMKDHQKFPAWVEAMKIVEAEKIAYQTAVHQGTLDWINSQEERIHFTRLVAICKEADNIARQYYIERGIDTRSVGFGEPH
jgi:hypothetical protein